MALTMALDQSKRPPIGAKMMPTAKNSGRTVFGVRIGLKDVNACAVSQWSHPDQRTAMLSIFVDGRQCLQSGEESGQESNRRAWPACLLAGLRLFGFLSWSFLTSSASMESVCATPVRDIV
jgi:hypothetical protein